MLAWLITTAARPRPRSQPGRAEPDQEHEQEHADLAEGAEDTRGCRTERAPPRPRRQPAEQRRPEQDARHHLAHHLRLAHAPEEQARKPRRHQDDRDLQHQREERHGAGAVLAAWKGAVSLSETRSARNETGAHARSRPPRDCRRGALRAFPHQSAASSRGAPGMRSARCPAAAGGPRGPTPACPADFASSRVRAASLSVTPSVDAGLGDVEGAGIRWELYAGRDELRRGRERGPPRAPESGGASRRPAERGWRRRRAR